MSAAPFNRQAMNDGPSEGGRVRVNSSRLVRICLAAIIVVMVAAAFITNSMIEKRQRELDTFSRFNIGSAAFEAVVEFQRLQTALLEAQREPATVATGEIERSFEAFRARAEVLMGKEFKAFASGSGARQQLLADLGSAVARLDRDFRVSSGPEAGAVLAALAPLEARITGFAREANAYRAASVSEHRRTLLELQRGLSGLTFGLIMCALCLVGTLTWHNRLLARAHRNLSATTADLRQTARELASANRTIEAANAELRRQNTLLSEKEDALRTQNVLFDAALNNMSQGLCMFDAELNPIVLNSQFESLFQVTGASVAKKPSLWTIAPELAPKLQRNVRDGGKASFDSELSDGRILAVTQQPMSGGQWVATFADVTEQRRAESRIAFMARYDVLTSLPNRYTLRERAQQALSDASERNGTLAMMCIDIDNFKEVNDALGHPAGDALLCAIGERLVRTVREGDVIARFGGDEFAILQPHIDRLGDAERLAVRLLAEMRKPFLIDGETVHATASIGVAVAPRHGSDPDALQKNADLALFEAKAEGKRTYRLFDAEMDERVGRRRGMELDLRRALTRDEFELFYQPVVHLRTRRMTGFEALLRWRHPVHGVVAPSRFIPVAEGAGLIQEIGRRVLAQACAAAARWPSHLKVSVNLSAAQFVQGDIVEDIRSALSRAGLRPERLVVEITESLLMNDDASTLQTLHRLKALNIDIAMDDFGTGYSSLSYLRKYPFDRIKIDRNFITSASLGDKSSAIVRTIVELGSLLGMTTVAEGIETETDLAMLLAVDCEEGQGYFFSRPMPHDKVFELIDADRHDPGEAGRFQSKVA